MSHIIAIDCDEVLIESLRGLIAYVKTYHNISWDYATINDYFLSKNPGFNLSDAQAIEFFDNYFKTPEAKDAHPVLGAYHKLTARKDLGYKLIVVTARSEKIKDLTYHQITNHFPDIFSDIYFAHHYTNNHIPKSSICKDIGAQLLIEDNLDYALEVAEMGISCALLEKPRNTHRKETHAAIHKTLGRDTLELQNFFM